MPTFDPIDPAQLAEMAQDVNRTAQNEDGLVRVTARPHGVITEIRVAPSLHNLGRETAADEIMTVIRVAQEQADRDFGQQVQSRLTAFQRDLFEGGQA